MRRFENLILEAEETLDAAPNPNNPDQPPAQDGGDQPPQSDATQEITSPEEFELAKLAVRALFFDPSKSGINPKIYDDFESKKNVISILNYVERKIDETESDEGFRVTERLDQSNPDSKKLKGMSIGKKLLYLNQNSKENTLDNGRRIFWTRIILNALKYNGNNYNLVEDDITPETIKPIFDKLKQDFNVNTRGTYSAFSNDVSGNTRNGPGVF